MNRPVWNLHAWDNYGDYVKVLETYCDELETKIKSLQPLVNRDEAIDPEVYLAGSEDDPYLEYWVCPSCGKEHEKVHEFCPECGQHIKWNKKYEL